MGESPPSLIDISSWRVEGGTVAKSTSYHYHLHCLLHFMSDPFSRLSFLVSVILFLLFDNNNSPTLTAFLIKVSVFLCSVRKYSHQYQALDWYQLIEIPIIFICVCYHFYQFCKMVKNCSAIRCFNRINKCKPGVHFHR